MLTSSKMQAAVVWQQVHDNGSFFQTKQGTEILSQVNSYTTCDCDSVYIADIDLIAGDSTTIDLTNLYDIFNNNFGFANVLGIMIACSEGAIKYEPAVLDGFNWFLSASSSITVNATGFIQWFDITGTNVTSSSKNILISEASGLLPAVCSITIIGNAI